MNNKMRPASNNINIYFTLNKNKSLPRKYFFLKQKIIIKTI